MGLYEMFREPLQWNENAAEYNYLKSTSSARVCIKILYIFQKI